MNFAERSLLLLLAGAASPALAQQAVPPVPEAPAPVEDAVDPDDAEDGEEIIVTGQRLRGAVPGAIEPEITLDRREVRALDAGRIAELLDALAPQTRSNRGRGEGSPVVLLNGRRISGFREIRDLPPEALDRVEVLPEEVALQYGFRADQRVVNIVLRRRFRATTVELEGGLPTAGGRSSTEFDLNLLRLDRAGRWSLDAEYSRDSALLESERDVEARPATTSNGTALDETPFRTLLPRSERLTLGGTLDRTIGADISATLDARFDAADTRSLFGLPMDATLAADPLTRDGSTRNARLGLSLNGNLSPWRWTLTGGLDRNRSASLTDTDSIAVPRARDRARSVDLVADGQFVANGPLLALPAGRATASVRLGASARDFSSDSLRSGVFAVADLTRDRANAQTSVDVPISSRSRGVLGAIGDLSLNANAEVDRLSDFGTLTTYGFGVNWEPIEEARLLVSWTDEDGAPSVQQLGDPLIEQANARVFDFTRGETALVTLLTGGNADLVADNRRVVKVGLTVKPLDETDVTLSADYTRSRTRNLIASFPTVTPEIEAAFADRFTRGPDGALFRIDSRPVNFARADRAELRYGFDFSKPLGRPDPAQADARAARRQARGDAPRGQGVGGSGRGGDRGGGRGGFSGPGGFGRGFGGRGPGNLQVGLYHNWRFEDSILIRDGVPELDLLNGSATGNRGGRPRHEVELQTGAFKNGFGARFTGNWQSGTSVRGLDAAGADDLRFGSFSTFNLRLFADLGAQEKLVRDRPFFRGTRVSLIVDNIFDTRLRVRDAAGLTPLSYQGDLLDPLGRSVRISLRKLFFPLRPGRRT
ncbi:MAG: TonB-dependent receptor [uncultured Sphingomonadaceae bacterium]|uniref:TonB-dependent receptor n=1 Tax=uncultured Sphingomonadaceae bacterium TaxID=169976 RepID=A0A6J4TKN5_9SPHN|nr:MAG: TonB-dependent receptor [uncultured Sphingomonadaceae bacterium]